MLTSDRALPRSYRTMQLPDDAGLRRDSVVSVYTKKLIDAGGMHRVWDRSALVMASAGPTA